MNISRLIDEPYVDMVALNERISSITSSGYYKSSFHFQFRRRPVQGVDILLVDGAYVLIQIMALSKSPKEKIILVPASNFKIYCLNKISFNFTDHFSIRP